MDCKIVSSKEQNMELFSRRNKMRDCIFEDKIDKATSKIFKV
jgi:hypothetical protein